MASRLTVKKHTLDSDEEDDIVPETFLKENDIQGQEEEDVTNIDIEEGIRFTPFHMKNELEEGHFDSHGMYHFKESKDEIYDQWIEDVNWSDVKSLQKTLKSKEEKEAQLYKEEKEIENINDIELFRKILVLLNPGENVLNAIKRLGKSGAKKLAKKDYKYSSWKNKKMKKSEEIIPKDSSSTENMESFTGNIDENKKDPSFLTSEEKTNIYSKNNLESISNKTLEVKTKNNLKNEQEINDPDKIKLNDLIGLADKLLLNGCLTIYQDTYEKMKHKIKVFDEEINTNNSNANNILEHGKIDQTKAIDLDIDIFNDLEGGEKINGNKQLNLNKSNSMNGNEVSQLEIEEVKWEFKWQNKNKRSKIDVKSQKNQDKNLKDISSETSTEETIHGPFTSREMLQWVEEGYFDDGIVVRKYIHLDDVYREFYSSKRIDFGLYL